MAFYQRPFHENSGLLHINRFCADFIRGFRGEIFVVRMTDEGGGGAEIANKMNGVLRR